MGETIRYLEQWEKRGSMPLWQEAFSEDTEEFLEYYYKEKTRDNRILVMEEDNRIVSMAHRNPYRLRLGHREADIDYIVAVATARDRRHRGYMRKLLLRMLKDMSREKMAFCFLMPADRRIYEPFGFTFIYDQDHWQLTPEAEETLTKEKVEPAAAAKAGEWMDQWLRQRYQVYAVRDKRYAKRLLLELASEKGWLEFLYSGERPGNSLVGIRGWWGIGKTEQRMLMCQDRYREHQAVPCPAIMARIADVKTCLELISLKKDSPLDELEVTLHVEDQVCLWNQGTFLWKLSRQGSKVRALAKLEESGTGKKDGLVISIENLTQWIFGYRELEEMVDSQELMAWGPAALREEPISGEPACDPGIHCGEKVFAGDALCQSLEERGQRAGGDEAAFARGVGYHGQEEQGQKIGGDKTAPVRWWREIGVWKNVFLDEIV